MKITEMTRRGKSEVYKLYVNDDFYCLLTAEVIVKNKIKTGQDIDEEALSQIKKQSDVLLSREMALKFVEKCLKTQKQVYDNLKQKGIDDDAINDAIEFLKKYGYIDDEYYAKQYVSSKKQYGKNYLKQKLFAKGIKKDIISRVLNDHEIDEDTLYNIVEKYIKNKTIDEKTKQKTYRYILSKGYTFDEAKNAVNKVFGDSDDWS